MIKKINNNTPQYKTLNSFSHNNKPQNRYLSYRYHQTRESERKEAVRALTGAVIGTAIPLLFFAKKQNKNIFKLNYGLKEIITVSAGSIIGGVLGGRIDNDKFDQRQKVNEGIFQFANTAIPAAMVAGFSKLASNIKLLNNNIGKAGAIIGGIITGMFTAAKVSNFICDPKDKVPDRKLTIKDSLANVDDALSALAMTDSPVLNKIPVGPILPLVYILCGYRAGESN